MGFYVTGSGPVSIQAQKLVKALEILNTGSFTNANGQKTAVKEYLSWALKINWDSIDSILDACGFSLDYDDTGNITSVDYESEGYHSDDVMVLALLSDLMGPGSHLDMGDESYHFWRWIFDPKGKDGCIYEDGMVIFPSDGVGYVENVENEGAQWKREPLYLLPDEFVTLYLTDGTTISGTVYEITYDRQYHTVKTVDILLPDDQIKTVDYKDIFKRSC